MAEERILALDVGGTRLKALLLDPAGRPASALEWRPTPRPATPEAVLEALAELAGRLGAFRRVALGFPGVVRRGVVEDAPNLGSPFWAGTDLARALAARLGAPARVANDADLQALGAAEGRGVELAVTLGTGLGTGLVCDGRLVPNLELGHHPIDGDRTSEDLVRDAELRRLGAEAWRGRVRRVLAALHRAVRPDRMHVGGGNARLLAPEDLPGRARIFTLEQALRGAFRLWGEER